jgi:hypothetical protein
MENEIAAKFPPNCSVKSNEQKAKAASPVLRHWELKPPSHPNAPFAERLLVYSTSRIAANPTTESRIMKNMSDLGIEDSPRATQAVSGKKLKRSLNERSVYNVSAQGRGDGIRQTLKILSG